MNRKTCFRCLYATGSICLLAILAAILLRNGGPNATPQAANHTDGGVTPHAGSPTVPRLDGRPREIVPGDFYLGDVAPTAVYAVRGAEGFVLIDSAVPFAVPKVLSGLSSLGLDPIELRAILLTHRHFDHSGGAEKIREMTGADIYAGTADAALLEAGGKTEDFHSFFPAPNLPLPQFPVDKHIDKTTDLRIAGVDLQAIVCPGHTDGSVCYVHRRGGITVLFGGDTVMTIEGDLGTFVLHYDAGFGGDSDAYLDTLKRLRELPVDVLLPGHPHLDYKPNPRVGPSGWRQIIDRGIAETEMLLARYQRDGRGFLNGLPRQISSGLLYFGEFNGRSAYAVHGQGGVVLVDPPSEAEFEDFFRRLEGLGVNAEQIRGILLTSASPDATAGAVAIGNRTGTIVRRPLGEVPAGERELILTGGEEVEIAERRFHVHSTPAPTSDALSYFVNLGNHLAAFTGDAVWSPASEPFLEQYAPEPLGSLREMLVQADDARLANWLASIEALKNEPVTLWLPLHPVWAQNAFLYEDRWEAVVGAQRKISQGVRMRQLR